MKVSQIPKVSIVISTWNSGAVLHHCLENLSKQTVNDFEIIIVDNGSSDKAIEQLQERWPTLNFQIKELEENKGFSVANNIGARLARGHWLALLNSDAFPEPDWLEQLLRAAESHPGFNFFASRQIQANAPELLDGAGDTYHISGLASRRFYNYPVDQFGLEAEEVFSACAAAAFYSREVFLQVGGFDEDFFSYLEDVDLSFRLQLQGFRCLYVPDAVVKHVGSTSVGVQSDFALYHWQRNYIWTFVHNMPSGLLWEALPAHLMANIIYQLKYTAQGRGKVLWKGKVDACKGLPHALQKRNQVQKTRKISQADLLSKLNRGWFEPYLLNYKSRKLRRG